MIDCVSRSSTICSNRCDPRPMYGRWSCCTRSGCVRRCSTNFATGVVRLDPDLTGLLARTLMPRFRKATFEMANDYAKQLRRITVPRRLVREAPKPIAVRRETWDRSTCGYCKEPLPRKGLKYCGRQCYLRYSVESRQADREGTGATC